MNTPGRRAPKPALNRRRQPSGLRWRAHRLGRQAQRHRLAPNRGRQRHGVALDSCDAPTIGQRGPLAHGSRRLPITREHDSPGSVATGHHTDQPPRSGRICSGGRLSCDDSGLPPERLRHARHIDHRLRRGRQRLRVGRCRPSPTLPPPERRLKSGEHPHENTRPAGGACRRRTVRRQGNGGTAPSIHGRKYHRFPDPIRHQVPMTPPSFLVIITVAERGRASAPPGP